MPLYASLMLSLMLGSLLLYLLLLWYGKCRRQGNLTLFRTPAREGTFIFNAPFPQPLDVVYPLVFLSFFILISALPLLQSGAAHPAPAPTENGGARMDILMLGLTLTVQLAVYLPMVLRYIMLPSLAGEGRRGFLWGLLRILIGLVGVMVPAMLIEHSGLYEWLAEYTGCPLHQEVVTALTPFRNTAEQYMLIGAAVLMAPVCEEVFFRGFLYNLLRKYGCGVLLSALSVGLLFGAVHTSLAQMLPLTIFGVVQCLIYEKSRTLWVPVGVHAVFNSLSVLAILLAEYVEQFSI